MAWLQGWAPVACERALFHSRETGSLLDTGKDGGDGEGIKAKVQETADHFRLLSIGEREREREQEWVEERSDHDMNSSLNDIQQQAQELPSQEARMDARQRGLTRQ